MYRFGIKSLIDVSSLVFPQLAVFRDVRHNDNPNYAIIIEVQSLLVNPFAGRVCWPRLLRSKRASHLVVLIHGENFRPKSGTMKNKREYGGRNNERGFIFVAQEQKTDAFLSVKVIKKPLNKSQVVKGKKKRRGRRERDKFKGKDLSVLLRDCKLE